MKRLRVGWLVWVFGAIALAVAGGVRAQETDVGRLSEQQSARRHAAIRDALQQVQEARNDYQAKRYTDAVEHYRNALSVLPEGEPTKKLREFIRVSLGDALIARAIDYRSVGRTEEAVEFLKEAIGLDPSNERAKRELVYTRDAVRTNPALTPQHVGNVEEVNRLLVLANGYYDLGDYNKAIETFQSVLRIDATNEAARRGIEMAHKKRQEYFRKAYDANRAAKLTEVDRVWENAMDIGTEDAPPIVSAAPVERTEQERSEAEQEQAYSDALGQMIIPSINVENADVAEVLDILRGNIKRLQKPGEKPINILTSFGASDTPEYKGLMQRHSTFRFDSISAKDLLKEIEKRFDVEYVISPLGIEITCAGQDFGRMVDRVYVVPPHFFDGEGGDEESDDEEAEGFASGKLKVKRTDPVAVLKRYGISFPKGAMAAYRSSTRRLTIRNTQRNIEQLEELLENTATMQDKQIVLTVKVAEVNEEDLEDLGFDWLLGMHLGGEAFLHGGVEQQFSNAPGMSITTPSNSVPKENAPSMTEGLRSIRQVATQQNIESLLKLGRISAYQDHIAGNVPSPTIFGIRGVWTTADVSVMMRGLSQKGGVDTLSSPKLVFSPGREEQAVLINVREMFYPSSYDPPQIPQQSSGNNYYNNNYYNNDDNNGNGRHSRPVVMPVAAGSHPSEFTRYGYDEDNVGGIGSILQVHNAEIAPDNSSVRLAITTTVNDFEGFVNWGSPISTLMWTDKEIEPVVLTPNDIYQPIFKRYRVNTVVTVRDGAVIVLGGLKEAHEIRYEDKVPIIGDLPLVGRLFRSSGTSRKRRALLIFAQVNVIDPTGNNIKGSTKGMAEEPDAPAL